MADKTTPDATSTAYDAMLPYWDMVETILGDAPAMRAAGATYLPQFPNEATDDYDYRLANAKFTNIFADIVGTLATKPFGEEVQIVESSASDTIRNPAEDIDGRGNSLHVFAAATFFGAITNAIDWILVDYTRARPRADGQRLSLADERRQGLRPYWVRIPAKRMLAVYSDVVMGREIIVHARVREDQTVRSNFTETAVERIRVYDRAPIYEAIDGVETDHVIGYAPATFTVYEKKTTRANTSKSWAIVDSGVITLGEIPLVPFKTGAPIDSGWSLTPPMRAAAHLQIEHYQQETALKSIKELTAYPMLAGNGVSPAMNGTKPAPVPVGPRAVLYAPPMGDSGSHGEWTFIEPQGSSLTFLAADVAATETQLRELGRQPLIASAGITAVGAAFASQKAASVLKSWALGLKDALEQALKLTAAWLSDASQPTISWNLDDLDLDTRADTGVTDLTEARKNGDLSQETYWSELRRRGTLSADFDADQERDRLVEEAPGLDTPTDVSGALTPDPTPDSAADLPNDQQAAA